MQAQKLAEIAQYFQDRERTVQEARGRFAVLVLLCEYEGKLCFLFELRADTLKGQPGEACFPGGRIESGESALDAALREGFEEVGLTAEDIQILAPLDFMVDISNRVIHPFLGYVSAEHLQHIRSNPDEVKELFFLPLHYLREGQFDVYQVPVHMEIHADFPFERVGVTADYAFRKGKIDVPIYEYEGKTVWGLSGRLLREVLWRLEEVGL